MDNGDKQQLNPDSTTIELGRDVLGFEAVYLYQQQRRN
jgi:hypothetical protein